MENFEKTMERERLSILLESLIYELSAQGALETYSTSESGNLQKDHYTTTATYYKSYIQNLEDDEFGNFKVKLLELIYELECEWEE